MKKRSAVALGVIQLFVAIGSIPSGLSMIFEPDGSGLGMPIEILKDTPFLDFFIPGLFLFFFNGLFNVVGAILSFRKNKNAKWVGLSLGVFLVVWIGVQVYFIGMTFFLQPLFLTIGIIEIILCLNISDSK